MTTVYVVTTEWITDGITRQSDLVGVFSTREKAKKCIAQFVNEQPDGWVEDLEAWEAMTDEQRVAAYYEFWNEDGYSIEKCEVDGE